MRITLGCVLVSLVCGACVAPAERCQGSLQQINPPPNSATSQTPAPTEPDKSHP